ncbi:MBL fold metallo-hydrolase [Cytobacillus sp. IB215316]|uniref:MBL fold metallo-hydrolase n=1 Tax=Cytobacillus sp. IB215316 TaxID=3097354 RepID=UPI002A241B1D|nr:MBL fold metallo-hydrolase [Cytobacillus sp. IB215316]
MMLHTLTKNIYYMDFNQETDQPILLLVVGKEKSLVIDAGNSPKHAEKFLEEVRQLNVPYPSYLAITHWHWDHVFGIETMNLPTISHEMTKEKLEEMSRFEWDDKSIIERVQAGIESEFCQDYLLRAMTEDERKQLKIQLPDMTFSGKLTINLGGVTCILEHVGGDHAPDSIVIHVPEERVLVISDCLWVDIYERSFKYSKENIYPLIDKILSYDVDYYVSSHINPETKQQLADYYLNVVKAIGDLVESNDTEQQAIQKFVNHYNRKPNEDERFLLKAFIKGV